MKALFIGCYRDGTTFGRLSQQILLGLDSAGIDVVARPLCFSTCNLFPLHNKIIELENKKDKDYDILIQHVPLNMLESGKEYGLRSVAVHHINNPSKAQQKHLAVVDKAIRLDMSQSFYSKEIYENTLPIKALNFLQENVIFYTIGKPNPENLVRWEEILTKFYMASTKRDRVALVIKVTGASQQVDEYFGQMTTRVREKLKSKYKSSTSFVEPIVITDIIDDEGIVGLHKAGDVYIDDFDTPNMIDAQICDSYVIQSDCDKDVFRQYMHFGKKIQLFQPTLVDDKFQALGKTLEKHINE